MAAVREQRARSVDGVRNMDHLRSYWRGALHRFNSVAVCRHWIGGWSIDDLKSPEHQSNPLAYLLTISLCIFCMCFNKPKRMVPELYFQT